MQQLVLLLSLLLMLPHSSHAAILWAVVTVPAPVFNTPRIAEALAGGRFTDRCGQNRALEFIALPGSVFQVAGEEKHGTVRVLQVTSAEYPVPKGSPLYLDSRLVSLSDVKPSERKRSLPPKNEVIARLLSAEGRPYVWGSNLQQGVASPTEKEEIVRFSGLDCSGLLYEATDGYTPRNTGWLTTFGRQVPVAGLSADRIAAMLEPLDLIVWPGHVIIVLDRERTIESRLECGDKGKVGVVILPLKERLAEVMRSRKPALDAGIGTFVVRRWYGR